MKFDASVHALRIFLILITLLHSTTVFPQTNFDQFDITYYQLKLEFFPTTEMLTGQVQVIGKSVVAHLDQITLNFKQNMQVDSITGPVSAFTHQNDSIRINLDRPYLMAEIFTLNIFYHGRPADDGTFSPVVFSHRRGAKQVETISTESCPYYARYWWPCKDTPADKPDSVDLRITVPTNLVVAANGVRQEIQVNANGTRTHYWKIRNPIATYLLTVQIADYIEVTDVYSNSQGIELPLHYLLFPEDQAKARSTLNKIKEMIRILSHFFGEYPFLNEKYGVAEYLGEWAAMEYQTLSCFSQSSLTDELTHLHELAHQWFGDYVSPRNFHHTWISEGFAVYAEALYQGYLLGEKEYHRYLNENTDAHGYHTPVYQADISSPGLVYPGVVYNKGAWVLHMLRHVVGDSVFFAALKTYLNEFGNASAVTEDLQHVFEAQSGQSLAYFFQQWIYGSWFPEYHPGWFIADSTARQFQLRGFIDQNQTEGMPVFKMPVDLTVEFDQKDTTFTIFVDEQGEPLNFTFSQRPRKLILDRDNWILKTVTPMVNPKIEYRRYQIQELQGDQNARPDPGETVQMIISLENTGFPCTQLWGILRSQDPNITILTDSSWFDNLPHRQPQTNDQRPFQFTVAHDASGHLSPFELELWNDLGYQTRLNFGVKIGKAPTLLVDDDQGRSYEQYLLPALESAKIYADHWNRDQQSRPLQDLTTYKTLLWFTGDSRDSTLTDSEQVMLQDFLAHGGRVLLSGQNIGFDLIEKGTAADSQFYEQILHARYLSDHTPAIGVMSISNAGLASGTQLFFNTGAAGAKNQNSMDVIEALPPARPFLIYLPGQKTAGLYCDDPSQHSRLVYLPFGLEGISGPGANALSVFLSKLFDWLTPTTAIPEVLTYEEIPEFFALSQNYPNPFNPRTSISYQLAGEARVQLEIFNLLGQKVRTLVNENQPSGFYQVAWDGNNDAGLSLASGIYLIQFQAGNYQEMKKMLIVR
ncbi:T9SS type A sorting domain-containing protein [candidate division KSB1 bacterium]|nr:T9SS type A sorting domain-containing protein [candidate division KSB1 bacterium]